MKPGQLWKKEVAWFPKSNFTPGESKLVPGGWEGGRAGSSFPVWGRVMLNETPDHCSLNCVFEGAKRKRSSEGKERKRRKREVEVDEQSEGKKERNKRRRRKEVKDLC